jgi:uncharacterized protein (TIGR03066 family)
MIPSDAAVTSQFISYRIFALRGLGDFCLPRVGLWLLFLSPRDVALTKGKPMNAAVKFSAASVVLLVAGFLFGQEAIDTKKLVGTWTLVKVDEPGAPPQPAGASVKVEFTKDGKMIVNMEEKDKKVTLSGTYKVTGDKMTSTVKPAEGGAEKTETQTISKLTDKQLIFTSKGKVATPKAPKGEEITITVEFKK